MRVSLVLGGRQGLRNIAAALKDYEQPLTTSTTMLTVAAKPPPADLIKDTNATHFMRDVIEASMAVPVIVDFWAQWCQPCKQLTPALEKIVQAMQGAVRLVKVDIDANPDIAGQFRIQSVPAVFAFFQGRPLDAFMGGMPESQLKRWIEGLLKAAGGKGGAPNPMAEIEAAIQQAEAHLTAGDWREAQEIFSEILGVMPEHAAAYAGLVRSILVGGHREQARAMFDAAPPEIAKDKAMDQARSALELADQATQAGPVEELTAKVTAQPDDHQARYDLALAFLAAGRRAESVEALLEIVRRQRGWNEEAARKQLVKLFETFGHGDPLTVEARKRLSSMLFS